MEHWKWENFAKYARVTQWPKNTDFLKTKIESELGPRLANAFFYFLFDSLLFSFIIISLQQRIISRMFVSYGVNMWQLAGEFWTSYEYFFLGLNIFPHHDFLCVLSYFTLCILCLSPFHSQCLSLAIYIYNCSSVIIG